MLDANRDSELFSLEPPVTEEVALTGCLLSRYGGGDPWASPVLSEDIASFAADLFRTEIVDRLKDVRQMFGVHATSFGKGFVHARYLHLEDVVRKTLDLGFALGASPYELKVLVGAAIGHDVGHSLGGHSGETVLADRGFEFNHDLFGLVKLSSDEMVSVFRRYHVDHRDVIACLAGPGLAAKASHLLEELHLRNLPHSMGLDLESAEGLERVARWRSWHSVVQDYADMLAYLERDYSCSPEPQTVRHALADATDRFIASLSFDPEGQLAVSSILPFVEVSGFRAYLYSRYACAPGAIVATKLLTRALGSFGFTDEEVLLGTDTLFSSRVDEPTARMFDEGVDISYPVLLTGVFGGWNPDPAEVRRFERVVEGLLDAEGLGDRVLFVPTPDFGRRYHFSLTDEAQDEAAALVAAGDGVLFVDPEGCYRVRLVHDQTTDRVAVVVDARRLLVAAGDGEVAGRVHELVLSATEAFQDAGVVFSYDGRTSS